MQIPHPPPGSRIAPIVSVRKPASALRAGAAVMVYPWHSAAATSTAPAGETPAARPATAASAAARIDLILGMVQRTPCFGGAPRNLVAVRLRRHGSAES